jgi:hypothetical protein
MRLTPVSSLAASALLAASSVSSAQASAPKGPPNVCPAAPERHQFDFWIGEWDVKTPGGGTAGKSVVQSIAGGCAILENWTSAVGGQGKSINAYNPATKQWQQYWIGQDGNPTEYRESTFDGKSLAFVAKSSSGWQRLTFTPLADGAVRQHGEISADEGRTWKTTYDFRYVKRLNDD